MNSVIKTTEALQLSAPPDIANRFSSKTFTNEELAEQYPGKTLYSYSTIACHVWDFLRRELSLKCLPPPFIIDRRKDIPTTRYYDEHGKLMTWINGICNHASVSITFRDGPVCIPMDYEVRLFHYNMLEEIRYQWGKHPVEPSILLSLTHTIMHEYCHFITLNSLYGNSVDDDESLKIFVGYLENSNSLHDEYQNENLTLLLLARYWLVEPYNLGDLGDVVIGGPYDLWRRTFDAIWEISALYLRKQQLANKLAFCATEEDRPSMLDEVSDIENQIAKILKENRKHAVDFCLID